MIIIRVEEGPVEVRGRCSGFKEEFHLLVCIDDELCCGFIVFFGTVCISFEMFFGKFAGGVKGDATEAYLIGFSGGKEEIVSRWV